MKGAMRLHEFVMREAASTGRQKSLTFAQARLLLRLIAEPGAALVITTSEVADFRGPQFHGFLYHKACAACGHANREATSWQVIHALAEAGCIKATWTDHYDKVTDIGLAAAEAAKARWPMMVIDRDRIR